MIVLTSSEDPQTILSVGLPHTVHHPLVPGLAEAVRLDPGLDDVEVDDGLPGQQTRQSSTKEDLTGGVLPHLRPPHPVQAELVGDEVDGVGLDVPGSLRHQTFITSPQSALPVDPLQTVPGSLSLWNSSTLPPQTHSTPHLSSPAAGP